MEFIAEGKNEDKSSGKQFWLNSNPGINAEGSPGEESKNGILRDVTCLSADSVPELQLGDRQKWKQELKNALDDACGVGAREGIGREEENHGHPGDQRKPTAASSIL